MEMSREWEKIRVYGVYGDGNMCGSQGSRGCVWFVFSEDFCMEGSIFGGVAGEDGIRRLLSWPC
ncbi:hypothetical protein COLO4_00116 [Corchorus olitorius]|uniref:Uncharacterized protein n=1 Tax=Corchorus olitorius TaxID=93759 RepID=A0A1R3L4J6_9ROSI|nr:hypothetical protein COLO4_00116 [Corchorus olitorius]